MTGREGGEVARSRLKTAPQSAGLCPTAPCVRADQVATSGAAPSAVPPAQASPGARLQEVASLLARGFLRSRGTRAVDGREKDLDVLRTSSDVCHEPQSEGEKRP